MMADPRATALFLGAFFDELARWGVSDVVVSPGSRSTPLSCTAYELSRRQPARMRVFVDVDERGAAFFALGLAKASGRPAALICTSGTAVANYYPAVLEAESSRVPLVVLTGDRPARLQGLGAPQTCDQLKAYGDHVRAFRHMPQPSADEPAIALARQAAREACIAARGLPAAAPIAGSGHGSLQAGGASSTNVAHPAADWRIAGFSSGGPVHLNFPFDEPLKPDLSVPNLFETGRAEWGERACSGGIDLPEHAAAPMGGIVRVRTTLGSLEVDGIARLLASRRVLVLAGEGTCETQDDAREVVAWARAFELPLMADPLSGLRNFDERFIIDNYDSVLDASDNAPDALVPDAIIRFGRYPVSKKATCFAASCPLQIVVDPFETRDFNAGTDVFVRCLPVDFARALSVASASVDFGSVTSSADGTEKPQHALAESWIAANDAARTRILAVDRADADNFEGSYLHRLVDIAPRGSCVFAANSMSVRALDTFYLKGENKLAVLCNRGLNGIDGTVSTALGAAQHFAQTTLVTGDLTLLHDLNALALQRELRVQRKAAACQIEGSVYPSIVIVLLNNNGGGIFDMLPQKSEDPYFERLFLTPQDVDFEAAARAFDVPYRSVRTVAAFEEAYRSRLGTPGISLIEVRVPLAGIKERYGEYW